MHTWIALLRGINVGGHKKIRMAELRDVCASLGFHAVATYIQSGNVVFRAKSSEDTVVATKMEEAIRGAFGFDVRTMVRNVAELEAVVEGNPFLAEGVADMARLHVTFLSETPPAAVQDEFATYRLGVDELRLAGREAYLHYPHGMGKSKLTPTLIDRLLGTTGTTRNWRTVNTLLEMARGL